MTLVRNILTLLLFFAMLLFVFINQIKPIVNDSDYNENKQKAEKPIFDINRLDAYPQKYEAYYKDNFSLRGRFLKMMGDVNSRLWNKSPKPNKLIIGKDKWLYSVYKELNLYLGKSNFTDTQIEILLDELNYRKTILDSMGIKMYVVLNPTKYTIYPENLPGYLAENTVQNTTDILVEKIKQQSDISIIYPKHLMLENKDNCQLYYKGDNHWNQIGAFYAAKEIINSLDLEVRLPDYPLSDFCIDTTFNWKGNLSQMSANADRYKELSYKLSLCENDAQDFSRYTYTPIDDFLWEYQTGFKSDNDSLPNVLIIRDSFGSALMPYIKNCFYHTTFIFDAWQYGFNREIIEQEKPDVVIYMALESLFSNILTKGLTKDKGEAKDYLK